MSHEYSPQLTWIALQVVWLTIVVIVGCVAISRKLDDIAKLLSAIVLEIVPHDEEKAPEEVGD